MYGYKTLFCVEPLEMDEIQRQIYDAIYSKWKFGCYNGFTFEQKIFSIRFVFHLGQRFQFIKFLPIEHRTVKMVWILFLSFMGFFFIIESKNP